MYECANAKCNIAKCVEIWYKINIRHILRFFKNVMKKQNKKMYFEGCFMKYKVKAKECFLTVQLKTSFGENIDERALDAFSRVYIRGFLKAKKIGKNKYEFTGPVGVSLKERFQKPISKRDVLFIVEHIVYAIQKLQNTKFPLDYLVTDMNAVFFNENTKELQFLYVPVINTKEKNDVMDLLSNIIYAAKPSQENDTEYLSTVTVQVGAFVSTITIFLLSTNSSELPYLSVATKVK